MSFDYTQTIASYLLMYNEIKLLNSLATVPWIEIFEKVSGASSFTTTSGVENITDKWIAFRSKATGNNAGTEDVKYTYFIIQLDTTNNRLIFRTASSVSNTGVTTNVTPLASAIKFASVAFPQNVGIVVDQNQFAVIANDGASLPSFACAAQLTSIITTGVDMDHRFCLTGSNTGCWVLPTTLYPTGDYQFKSAVVPYEINQQISSFHLFPLAVYDSIGNDKFIGYVQDLHLVESAIVQLFDIVDNVTSWYRAARKNADNSFVIIKEGVAQ